MATQIAEIGEFGLRERIAKNFPAKNKTTIMGIGDDAAVIECGGKYMLASSKLLLEGVNFDLVYTPLAHLGYKSVAAVVSDIYAMNGVPRQIIVSAGVSARFTVEQIDELYKGIKFACDDYGLDLAGGNTSSSLTGLTINVAAVGEADKDKIVCRGGANKNDLICVSGDLGAAFMGLKLLEREKMALEGIDDPVPEFGGHEYPLRRQLRPDARRDITEALGREGIIPTSMIDISDGLASEMLHICKDSGCGARIYLERIPIARETFALAEELRTDPVIAALSGGEDYELLLTVPLCKKDEIEKIPGLEIIGHIVPESEGAALVTPDGQEIPLRAQGWV